VSSKSNSEPLSLSRGLKTTPQDNAVLRSLRYASMTDGEYVRFLAELHDPEYRVLAAKRGPGGEAFRLP
jgi:hypothetical protein